MKQEKIDEILELVEKIVECEINLYKMNNDSDMEFIKLCKNRGVDSLFKTSIKQNKELIKEILLNN